jgi:glycerol kinase
MQFQADLIGGSLTRPQNAETTALGAGVLAGLAAAVWRSTDEVADLRAVDREFKPLISSRERAELISGWQDAVARVVQRPLSGPEPAKG